MCPTNLQMNVLPPHVRYTPIKVERGENSRQFCRASWSNGKMVAISDRVEKNSTPLQFQYGGGGISVGRYGRGDDGKIKGLA